MCSAKGTCVGKEEAFWAPVVRTHQTAMTLIDGLETHPGVSDVNEMMKMTKINIRPAVAGVVENVLYKKPGLILTVTKSDVAISLQVSL